MNADDYVALGAVTRPHGIRGELKVKVFNPDSSLLASQRTVRMVMPDDSVREVTVRQRREVPGGLIVRLEGVDDRDAAEALRGARFEVSRSELGPTEEGEYFVVDLVGCRAMVGDETIGEVVDVIEYPTCEALVIQRPDGRVEIPMLEVYVGEVDVAGRRIEIKSLEGLA